MELIYFLLIGLAAGYLAGLIFKPSGATLLINLVVGVCGAFLGGFLFQVLQIQVIGGLAGQLLTATCGAIVLMAFLKLVKR